MKYQELIILLPCHSLEDFPTHHEGEEADGLLANWTAMWHPALIASAESTPAWHRVDDPPEELEDRLLLIPSVSHNELPTGFAQRAKQAGAVVVRRKSSRPEILEKALEALDEPPQIDAEIVADFLALGYCFLQVELLTRQMRYSSNLDELHFQNQALAAAQAAAAGETEQARDLLVNCFDILAEERDHYYSVDAFILDLTMVAETTLGAGLRGELSATAPVNLLISGDLLELMATKEPETLSLLKKGVAEERIGIATGTMSEGRWSLQHSESVLAEIKHSIETCKRLLDAKPTVFGRRRFGLTPIIPQILTKAGFDGALHVTFEDGRFPEGSQFKIRWEGADATAIDAIARHPQVASDGGTFLSLATKLGESMDMDHVATVLLAHWPGQASPWYEDLRRVTRYGNALGRFITLDEYFRDTDLPGHLDSFPADNYKSPFLKQAVIRRHANPISSVVKYWKHRLANDSATNANLLQAVLKSDASIVKNADDARDSEAFANADENEPQASLQAATNDLVNSLPLSTDGEQGILVTNTLNYTRRVMVETEWNTAPTVGEHVYATHKTDGGVQLVLDVPPMGFSWVGPGNQRGRVKRAENLADETMLRNEFFEALINPQTGSLQSLNSYEARGNLLSQQLAYREPGSRNAGGHWQDPDATAIYSKMKAESIRVVTATPIVGVIETKGVLVHPASDKVVGKFRQTYRVVRGSRVLNVRIHLEPLVDLKSDPWSSYYACRFAWANEACMLQRAVNQFRQGADSKRIEAPLYMTIDDVKHKTSILTGGLPFHRRQGMRSLDSILIVKGEDAREFELGIGVDLPYPIHQAIEQIVPPTVSNEPVRAPQPAPSSWLLHVGAKNVLATHWSPLVDESGSLTGIRCRLQETQSRNAEVELQCFRDFREAKQVDFMGNTLSECRVV